LVAWLVRGADVRTGATSIAMRSPPVRRRGAAAQNRKNTPERLEIKKYNPNLSKCWSAPYDIAMHIGERGRKRGTARRAELPLMYLMPY